MKKIMLSLFILCVLSRSPLYAGYEEMKQTLEGYVPPENFTAVGHFDARAGNPTRETGEKWAPLLSQIDRLKQTYEEKNSAMAIAPANMDPTVFKAITAISSDQEAVQKHLRRKLVLEEIILMAALRNPGVLAAQKKTKAEIQSFSQIMNLDDTLKQYWAFTRGISNKTGPLKIKGTMKLTYPFPGVSALKGRVINSQVAVLMEKMKIVRKKVITDIRKYFWDLVFIKKSTRITAETIAAFNRLKNVATILYKSGKTSFQDVIKININIEILKEDLITLAAQKKNIEIRLLELLNLTVDTRMGKTMASPLPDKTARPGQLYPVAREYRQELNVIRQKITKLENMIEISESMIQAPFSLGFSNFENEQINTTGTDAPKASFAVKTMAAMKNNHPVNPWYGVDQPWLQQTRQNLLSLKQTLVEQENATDRMVRDAWFDLDRNRREFELYSTRILPLSKSALDVATREYETGSIPFSQAIDSYHDWLKVKLTIAKKQTDIAISTAVLEKIMGKNF